MNNSIVLRYPPNFYNELNDDAYQNLYYNQYKYKNNFYKKRPHPKYNAFNDYNEKIPFFPVSICRNYFNKGRKLISNGNYYNDECKNPKMEEKRKSSLDSTDIGSKSTDSNEEEKEEGNKMNNKEYIKEKVNKDNYINPKFENTEILHVKVKIAKDKYAVFRLKRFDDIFETIKLFCEIYKINEKMIKPLIIKSLCAINTIYQIMNSQLGEQQINIIKKIQRY